MSNPCGWQWLRNIRCRSKFCRGHGVFVESSGPGPRTASHSYRAVWSCSRWRHKPLHASKHHCTVHKARNALARWRMQVLWRVRSVAVCCVFSWFSWYYSKTGCDGTGMCCEKKMMIGWRNAWRAPDQEEDQRGPGERLWKRYVKHVNWTRRMLWIVIDGESKVCLMTRMGVSGWMFLLVPAYPGSPGPKDQRPLNGSVCVCACACCVCCGLASALAVPNWRSRLTQVDLHNSHRMMVGPALSELHCILKLDSSHVFTCMWNEHHWTETSRAKKTLAI